LTTAFAIALRLHQWQRQRKLLRLPMQPLRDAVVAILAEKRNLLILSPFVVIRWLESHRGFAAILSWRRCLQIGLGHSIARSSYHW